MTDRMDLLSTRSYTTRDGETKNAFTKIGVAFATKNGGWSLTFEALPLPSLNDKGQIETRVLMMPPRQDSDAPPARQPANRVGGARAGEFASGHIDQDIPFAPEWRG